MRMSATVGRQADSRGLDMLARLVAEPGKKLRAIEIAGGRTRATRARSSTPKRAMPTALRGGPGEYPGRLAIVTTAAIRT